MGRLDRICSTHWQIPINHHVSAGWKCSFCWNLIVKGLNTKKELWQPTFISPSLLLSLPSGQQRSAFSPSLSQLWSLYTTMLHSSHHSSHFLSIPSPISRWNHFLLSSVSCDENVRARGQDRPGQLTFFWHFPHSHQSFTTWRIHRSTSHICSSLQQQQQAHTPTYC